MGTAINDKELEKYTANPELYISKQFSKLFSSYTQAFNKLNYRMGSLFMKNFKRKRIDDEAYFKKLVHYIHHNPVEAGLSPSPQAWLHSSYRGIVTHSHDTIVDIRILDYFGSLDNFIAFHQLSAQLASDA